ncbi:hypothetical protein FGG08_004012 [Glutinoglossum americanum]|uniref:Zn(2)-C6 fungal-type domain-containing protein n=1 Tax=Glutinoglossum americanum TaxID=1670608 RepID=A0A9P8KXJ1_9PEZI|nr:hypothetical protein FGG08_004012 [Glutinoglossum americanum]
MSQSGQMASTNREGPVDHLVRTPVATSRGSRQITRNRASYSCHACRRRKVHPVCGQCAKIGAECLFNNTQDTNRKATSQSGSATNIHPMKNGDASPHDAWGMTSMSSREDSHGQKRRRTIGGLHEPAEIIQGPPQQTNISYDALIQEDSSAPPASSAEDIEGRLHRLTEIVQRYIGNVAGNGSANTENVPLSSAWQQGKPWNLISGSQDSALEALNDQNTSSVSSASEAAETRYEDNPNVSGLDALSSSSSHGRTVKPKTIGRQPAQGRADILSHILKSSSDDLSSNSEINAPQSIPALPYSSAPQARPRSRKHLDTGVFEDTKDFREHEKKTRTSHQAAPPDSVGDLALGHLSLQEGGQSMYMSNTFWAYIGGEISELNQLLRDQGRQRSSLPMGRSVCPSTQNPHSGRTDSSGDFNVSAHPMPMEILCANASYLPDMGEPSPQKPCLLPMKGVTDKVNLLRFEDPDGTPDAFPLPTMLSELPSKQQCDLLYRGFMTGVHPIIPLVHPPRFHQDYSEFWEWMEHREDKSLWPTSILYRQPTLLPLIFAIIYGGSISCSAKELSGVFGSTPKANINEKLYNATTKSLSIVSFPRITTIASLSALLIVQTLMIREEQPMTSCMFIGLALRVAQSMGLHRDGSHYGIEPVEAEVRRRVWWHILHMDVMTALASGLPPLVNGEGLYDTRPISELKDEYIGTPEGIEYERAVAEGSRSPDAPDDPIYGTKTSMTAACYVMTAGRYFESTIVRKLLGRILGVKSSSRKEMEEVGIMLDELHSELDKRISRIPTRGLPEMGFTPEVDAELDLPTQVSAEGRTNNGLSTAGDNDWQLRCDEKKLIAFHAWSRILLSLLVDKAFGVLYQPLLKSTKSKFWVQGRQWWCYPGTYQPMHATMILLVDLYERPDSPEAPRSRSFIDEIFSMFGPDGGIVTDEDGVTIQRPLREGGREAWALLKSLRRTAWEKAGLDPDVMWTEERQRKAGYLKPLTANEKLMRQMREDFLIKESVVQCIASVCTTAAKTPADAILTSDMHGARPAGPTTEGNEDPLSSVAIELAKTAGIISYPQISSSGTTSEPGIPCFSDAPTEPHLQDQIAEKQPEYQLPGPNPNPSCLLPFPPVTNPQPFTQIDQELPSLLPDTTIPTTTTILLNNGDIPTSSLPPSGGADKPSSPSMQQPQPQENITPLDDMDADFDWGEWDAVFGKFVGLADDLMDVDLEGLH